MNVHVNIDIMPEILDALHRVNDGMMRGRSHCNVETVKATAEKLAGFYRGLNDPKDRELFCSALKSDSLLESKVQVPAIGRELNVILLAVKERAEGLDQIIAGEFTKFKTETNWLPSATGAASRASRVTLSSRSAAIAPKEKIETALKAAWEKMPAPAARRWWSLLRREPKLTYAPLETVAGMLALMVRNKRVEPAQLDALLADEQSLVRMLGSARDMAREGLYREVALDRLTDSARRIVRELGPAAVTEMPAPHLSAVDSAAIARESRAAAHMQEMWRDRPRSDLPEPVLRPHAVPMPALPKPAMNSVPAAGAYAHPFAPTPEEAATRVPAPPTVEAPALRKARVQPFPPMPKEFSPLTPAPKPLVLRSTHGLPGHGHIYGHPWPDSPEKAALHAALPAAEPAKPAATLLLTQRKPHMPNPRLPRATPPVVIPPAPSRLPLVIHAPEGMSSLLGAAHLSPPAELLPIHDVQAALRDSAADHVGLRPHGQISSLVLQPGTPPPPTTPLSAPPSPSSEPAARTSSSASYSSSASAATTEAEKAPGAMRRFFQETNKAGWMGRKGVVYGGITAVGLGAAWAGAHALSRNDPRSQLSAGSADPAPAAG